MILVLTTADTEILAARAVMEDLPFDVRAANPSNLTDPPDVAGVDAVLVRLLGGRRAWEEQFDVLRRRCLAAAIPLWAFGGEAHVDAELASLSTVAPAAWTEAFDYWAKGGLHNTRQLLLLAPGLPHGPAEEIPPIGSLRISDRIGDEDPQRTVSYCGSVASMPWMTSSASGSVRGR